MAKKPTISEIARMLVAQRKHHNGGRPRSDAPRCACGRYTLSMAKVRYHHCEGLTAEQRAHLEKWVEEHPEETK